MQEKENSLCFSGLRSEKLPKSKEEYENLKLRLCIAIDKAIKSGIDIFYFGACYGFDLLCAVIVLLKRRENIIIDSKQIRLIAVVPFEELS